MLPGMFARLPVVPRPPGYALQFPGRSLLNTSLAPHLARPLALRRLDEAEIVLRLAARQVLAADPACGLHDVMDLAGVQLHVDGRGTCLSWRLRVKKHALTKNPDLIPDRGSFHGVSFLRKRAVSDPDPSKFSPAFLDDLACGLRVALAVA